MFGSMMGNGNWLQFTQGLLMNQGGQNVSAMQAGMPQNGMMMANGFAAPFQQATQGNDPFVKSASNPGAAPLQGQSSPQGQEAGGDTQAAGGGQASTGTGIGNSTAGSTSNGGSGIYNDIGTTVAATGDIISMASKYFKKWNPEKNRPLSQKIGLVSHTGNSRLAYGGHLFTGGGNMVQPIAQQAVSDFQNAFSLADTQDTQQHKDELTSYGNKPVSASSFDDLNSQKAYEPNFSHVTWQDVYGRNGGEIAGQIIGGVGRGISNGSKAGGLWGAIGGAGSALISGLIGMGIGIDRSKKQARELNETIDETEMRRQASYENELENLQQNQFMNNMTAFAAEGGRIHIKPSGRGTFTEAAKRRGMGVQEFARTVLANKDRYSPAMVKKANFARNAARWHDDGGDLDRMPFFDDALLFTRKYKEYYPKGDTFEKGGTMHRFDIGGMMDNSNGQVLVNRGGSHEENKYEGVPMGMAVDGKPNLVEEGEVVYDDYVFSDRMFPTKEQLREARFPESWTKKSFAKIAEELGKESKERPNDPISKEGLDNAMRRLMNAQEKAREEKRLKDRADAMDKIKVAMDAMTPQQRQAMEEMSLEQAAQQQAMARQEEQQAMQQGMGQPGTPQQGMPMMAYGGHLFYDGSSLRTNYPPSDPIYSVQFNEDYSNPILGIGTDKDGNPVFREYNTRKERKKAEGSKEYKDAQKKAREEITEEIFEYRNLPDEEKEKYSAGQRAKYRILSDLYGINMDTSDESSKEGTKGQEGEEGQKTRNEKLRYAPAIGSGLQYLSDILGLTNNPDHENAMRVQDAANRIRDVAFEPIGNYMRYNPLDRNFYLNQLAANSAATRRSIMDNANGNQGARNAALLAADYNAQLAQGQLARQAEEYNLQQRMQAEDFNRRTNMFNSQMGLSAQAQNQSADTQRASLISQAAQMRQEEDMAAAVARSANMSNFYENLGNIGRENKFLNMISGNKSLAFDYDDKEGFAFKPGQSMTEEQRQAYEQGKYTDEQLEALRQQYFQPLAEESVTNAYGGRLRNRRQKTRKNHGK